MLAAILVALCLLATLFFWGAAKALRSRSYWDRVAMRWMRTDRPAGYIGEAVFMAIMGLLSLATPAIYWLKEMQ
jgi:hypothetical protein